MLKTIESLNKLAFDNNNGNQSASSRNDNSKLAFKKNNGANEVNRFNISGNNVKHT